MIFSPVTISASVFFRLTERTKILRSKGDVYWELYENERCDQLKRLPSVCPRDPLVSVTPAAECVSERPAGVGYPCYRVYIRETRWCRLSLLPSVYPRDPLVSVTHLCVLQSLYLISFPPRDLWNAIHNKKKQEGGSEPNYQAKTKIVCNPAEFFHLKRFQVIIIIIIIIIIFLCYATTSEGKITRIPTVCMYIRTWRRDRSVSSLRAECSYCAAATGAREHSGPSPAAAVRTGSRVCRLQRLPQHVFRETPSRARSSHLKAALDAESGAGRRPLLSINGGALKAQGAIRLMKQKWRRHLTWHLEADACEMW